VGVVSDYPILRGLEKASYVMDAYLSRRFSDLGITESEAHVLMHLEPAGRETIAGIQSAFGMRPSTLTSIVDRLERGGYVVRSISAADRRSLEVSLTGRGRRLAERVVMLLRDVESAITRDVGTANVSAFSVVVEAIGQLAGRKDVD
jgi:DNA-binding MarR family transcriptional regulator